PVMSFRSSPYCTALSDGLTDCPERGIAFAAIPPRVHQEFGIRRAIEMQGRGVNGVLSLGDGERRGCPRPLPGPVGRGAAGLVLAAPSLKVIGRRLQWVDVRSLPVDLP